MAPPPFPIPREQVVMRSLLERRYQLPIRTIVIRAYETARSQVDIQQVASIIAGEQGSLLDLQQMRILLEVPTALGIISVDLAPVLEKAILQGALVGAPIFSDAFGTTDPLDETRFRSLAQQAARVQVGELITNISNLQLAGVREILADGWQFGVAPSTVAERLAQVVTLDSQRAAGFQGFLRDLAENPPDLSSNQIQRLIDREYQQRLRSRGQTIAATELLRSASEAQDVIWEQAVAQGELGPAVWQQEWVASPGACPRCRALHGKRAPIGGSFPPPGGQGPPNPHPWCRCGRRLRRV